MQLASLADMGVSLPRDEETSVCYWSSLCILIVYSSVGRIVGVSDLCTHVSFYPLHCLAVGESNSGNVVCQLA